MTKDYIDNPDWDLPPLIGAKRHTKARGTGDGRSLRRKPYPFFLGEGAADAVYFVESTSQRTLVKFIVTSRR